jgi:hypothetical protein
MKEKKGAKISRDFFFDQVCGKKTDCYFFAPHSAYSLVIAGPIVNPQA